MALAWLLSIVIRFALSRQREYLADAGAVELTKNPDAMITALRKIENRGELEGATSAVMEMCVDNPRSGIRRPVRHPSVDRQPGRRDRPLRRRARSRADRAARAGSRRVRTKTPARIPAPAVASRAERAAGRAARHRSAPAATNRSCRHSRRSKSAVSRRRLRRCWPLGPAPAELIPWWRWNKGQQQPSDSSTASMRSPPSQINTANVWR